jgi:hypothetical protein
MAQISTAILKVVPHPSSLETYDSDKSTDALTNQLQIASARLQIAVLALIALTICFIGLSVILGDWNNFLHIPADIQLNEDQISGVSLLVLIALGSAQPLTMIAALWHLHKLLSLYRNRKIFTVANVTAIKGIGWSLVLVDVAKMIQVLLTGPILSYFQISSEHLALTLQFGFLIIGLFIVLVTRVMDIARKLKDQNSLVI